MEVVESILGYFTMFWLIAFPFLYGQLLSRLFGLRKKIDHWILFFLHIAVCSFSLIVYGLFEFGLREYSVDSTVSYIIPLVFVIASAIVAEGIVWQFSLRDRKMNGFLISLICNAAFLVPLIPETVYLVNTLEI